MIDSAAARVSPRFLNADSTWFASKMSSCSNRMPQRRRVTLDSVRTLPDVRLARQIYHHQISHRMSRFSIGTGIAPAAEVANLARRAETAGFDALWTSEMFHDPFLPLASAATALHESGSARRSRSRSCAARG